MDFAFGILHLQKLFHICQHFFSDFITEMILPYFILKHACFSPTEGLELGVDLQLLAALVYRSSLFFVQCSSNWHLRFNEMGDLLSQHYYKDRNSFIL